MNKFHSFSHIYTSRSRSRPMSVSHHGFNRLGSLLLARINNFSSSSCSYRAKPILFNSNWTKRSLTCIFYHGVSKKQTQDILSFKFCKLHRTAVFNQSTASPFTFSNNQRVAQDTLIFSHHNGNFFKFLSIFGVVQMFIWGYLSIFSVQELRSGPVIKKDTSTLPWWQKFLYTEGRYKNAISTLCFIVGASIFFITSTYPRRAVKKLWLLKGGKDVKITSYSWFGQTHTFKTPVEHINCIQSRSGSGSQVPFKIKGKHFFFLLDKQGSFHNPELFDFVIGLERNWK